MYPVDQFDNWSEDDEAAFQKWLHSGSPEANAALEIERRCLLPAGEWKLIAALGK